MRHMGKQQSPKRVGQPSCTSMSECQHAVCRDAPIRVLYRSIRMVQHTNWSVQAFLVLQSCRSCPTENRQFGEHGRARPRHLLTYYSNG